MEADTVRFFVMPFVSDGEKKGEAMRLTAERYIGQIASIDAILKKKTEEYRSLKEDAEGIRGFSVGERVQSPKDPQASADVIVRYLDVEREITALKRKRDNIMDTLRRLPYTEYVLLYRFYVDGYTLRELAMSFDRSYVWAKKTKRRALSDLQAILDE